MKTVNRLMKEIIELRVEKYNFEEHGYSYSYAGDQYDDLVADLAKLEYALDVVELVLDEIES
jgi:hypothetical protein